VSCGSHKNKSCSACPRGKGAAYCNGDCRWIRGQCVLKSIGGLYCYISIDLKCFLIDIYYQNLQRYIHQLPLTIGNPIIRFVHHVTCDMTIFLILTPLKGNDITNYINFKHSGQEFSLFQIKMLGDYFSSGTIGEAARAVDQ
jgi:hypothetical protein